MGKQVKKQSQKKANATRFEPDRVLFMIVVVSVLAMVFIGALTTL